MNDALVQELVTRSAILNNHDPWEGKSADDMKSKYPLAARGCPGCKGKGFYLNVILRNETPYMVAVVCQCMQSSGGDE